MPSGCYLTVEDRDRILKLAGLRNPDGSWAMTYRDIGEKMKINPITVSCVIRLAGVKWGQEHAWHQEHT